jgi:serine/threonine-protein kinase
MTDPNSRLQDVERLYHEAQALDGPARESLLAGAAATNPKLVAEVRSLLQLESAAGAFLTRPALEQVATLAIKPVPGQLSGRQIHGYELRTLLGSGGMGEVYLARDLRLGRDVALKTLSPTAATDVGYLRRFEDEARSASVLNHPNIVTIYGVGEQDDVRYIAMERVLGRTLREIIASADLAIPAVLDLAVQLADALAVAHANGIVHRDLKPENVMVTPEGLLKVLDFGIARREGAVDRDVSHSSVTTIGTVQTEVGTILGTVGYMSPEQAAGRRAGPASDQFSFGAILYELVTGKRAFERGSRSATLDAIAHEQPPPIQTVNANAPPPLRQLVERCLRKEPADRFSDTREIASALRAIHAQVTGAGLSRRRALLLGAAAAVVASTGATAWVLWPRGPRVRSLAVLPFVNAAGDPEVEPLCQGLATTLIQRIRPLSSIHVAAASLVANFKGSARDPRDIGREIEVESVLVGGVSRQAGGLVITASLDEVATGRPLWSNSYERTADELLTIQNEIATAIVDDGIRLQLTNEERRRLIRHETNVPQAYDLYLRALAAYEEATEDGYLQTRDLLLQAIDADEKFARAYLKLAMTYTTLAVDGFMLPADASPLIARYLRPRDPDLALETQAQAATYEFFFNWQWDAADVAWDQATRGRIAEIDSITFVSRAVQQWALGNIEAALGHIRLVRKYDRLSPYFAIKEADLLTYTGRPDDAIVHYQSVYRANPTDPRPLFGLAEVHRLQGRYDDAIKFRRLAHAGFEDPGFASVLADARGREGYDRIERRWSLLQLSWIDARAATGAYVDPYDYARTFARLGRRADAFRELDAAFAARAPGLVFLNVDRSWDTFRGDPKFKSVVAKVRLPARS